MLEKDEFRLYQLIWNRFVASQMNAALYDLTAVDVATRDSQGNNVVFRASGSVMKFPGFAAVYLESQEDSAAAGAAAKRGESPDGEEGDKGLDQIAHSNFPRSRRAMRLQTSHWSRVNTLPSRRRVTPTRP